ncbi:MAG: type II toxin-antitoxin system Phd/YefM family antitoxin [Patescibacteria group bacterium]
MMQIVSISDARNNFAQLIQKVKKTREPIIVVQGSSPSVVLYPYEAFLDNEEKEQKLFQVQFKNLLSVGKEAGKRYLAEKNIKKKLSEEEIYDLIKNE